MTPIFVEMLNGGTPPSEIVISKLEYEPDNECYGRKQTIKGDKEYHPYGRKLRRTKEPLDESERGE